MVELDDDKYTKMAKAIKCILEKAEIMKEILDSDNSASYKKRDRIRHRDEDYDDDYDYDYRRPSRYM
jgi:hypothetical protein